ncbi:hypothetical protein [Aquabacter sediminis]|uniref:hypothetical protein n=1 Tax=Aquabacter sediminis TaxID=3029197 RepID=UPI00237D8B4C|nr:hypothetical protein [Aquabacter sp. P-9]MDE1568939.1 hypothetical protein [Aquabacter sp. P-9]
MRPKGQMLSHVFLAGILGVCLVTASAAGDVSRAWGDDDYAGERGHHGGGGHHGAPGPLAGVGLPALAVAGLYYVIRKRRQG